MSSKSLLKRLYVAGVISIVSPLVHSVESFEDPFGVGKSYVGLQFGYGSGFSIGETGSGDGKNVEYFSAFPSIATGISGIFGEDSWYRGNFDAVGEAEFFKSFHPNSGYSAGVGLLLRYNFQSGNQFIPYVEVGGGVGTLDFDLRDQSDGLIFYPQAGFGFHYFVSDRTAINLSWRLHHMSNAGSEQPNNGINASLGLIGISYRFD